MVYFPQGGSAAVEIPNGGKQQLWQTSHTESNGCLSKEEQMYDNVLAGEWSGDYAELVIVIFFFV